MLSTGLLYLSRARWARSLVTGWGVARRVARRFVAGETEDEVVAAIRAINRKGMTVSVDILGESTTDTAEAGRYTEAYCHLIERMATDRLQSSVSLKLTALGLDVDPDICRENLRRILMAARDQGVRVTIDMEDHAYTDRTLGMLRDMRAQGFENAQGVIQACLYRSQQDIPELASEGIDIRLCKGAYREPPSVGYPKKKDVDAAYARLMAALLNAASAGSGYPGIATHDEKIIAMARSYVAEHNIPLDRFEFQMLYGIRSPLQAELAAAGYGMRVYVPFGSQWYPYLMRRLAERPANLWFFVRSLLSR